MVGDTDPRATVQVSNVTILQVGDLYKFLLIEITDFWCRPSIANKNLHSSLKAILQLLLRQVWRTSVIVALCRSFRSFILSMRRTR